MFWDGGRRGDEGEEVKRGRGTDCRFVLKGEGVESMGVGRVKGRGVLWFVVLLSQELFELQHLSVRQLSVSQYQFL